MLHLLQTALHLLFRTLVLILDLEHLLLEFARDRLSKPHHGLQKTVTAAIRAAMIRR